MGASRVHAETEGEGRRDSRTARWGAIRVRMNSDEVVPVPYGCTAPRPLLNARSIRKDRPTVRSVSNWANTRPALPSIVQSGIVSPAGTVPVASAFTGDASPSRHRIAINFAATYNVKAD